MEEGWDEMFERPLTSNSRIHLYCLAVMLIFLASLAQVNPNETQAFFVPTD